MRETMPAYSNNKNSRSKPSYGQRAREISAARPSHRVRQSIRPSNNSQSATQPAQQPSQQQQPSSAATSPAPIGFSRPERIMPHKFFGIFTDNRRIYTKNLVPGMSVYGEKLVRQGKDEFREWDVTKSKLAAALAKGISQIGIKPGQSVLYLGASYGTTPSHVSDLVGNGGIIIALDFAPRVVRDLVMLCEQRQNMIPVMADAHLPQMYYHMVPAVDVVYQDVAQRDQAEIFLKNCALFLKSGGFGILCVKARSIDVSKNPREVFRNIREKLEKEMIIVDYRELDPYEKDHCIFVCKKK